MFDTVNSTGADLAMFDFLIKDINGQSVKISEGCMFENPDIALSKCS